MPEAASENECESGNLRKALSDEANLGGAWPGSILRENGASPAGPSGPISNQLHFSGAWKHSRLSQMPLNYPVPKLCTAYTRLRREWVTAESKECYSSKFFILLAYWPQAKQRAGEQADSEPSWTEMEGGSSRRLRRGRSAA